MLFKPGTLIRIQAEPFKRKRSIWLILIAAVVLFIFGVSLSILNSQQTKKVSSNNSNAQAEALTPTLSQSPTPFPFQELTIPYLRNRAYVSKMGSLKEVSKNNNYISYTTSYNSDGLSVEGLLTVPMTPMSSKMPAIIFIHGYIPPDSYQTTVNYASYVDYFARNGFVVFKIDLRGHGNSEGEASGAYYSGDYIVDTLNAYEALKTLDFVDSEAIGLWGHSMAGNVVLRTLAARPEFPAAVIWAGAVYTYTDMQEFGIQDGSYRALSQDTPRARYRQELRDTYGNFDAAQPFWQQVAATNYLSDITGAIQIHHTLDDSVVSVNYSRNLKKLLDSTGVVNSLREYQSGGHNLTGTTFIEAMNASVEFFKQHL